MRKGTLFLSAVLTTFMLAVMAAGTSAYQNLVKSRETAFKPVEAAAGINAAAPQESSIFTPEQAAALASQVIGRTDLYSVETADFNGASTYLVTFSSGDIVYVSLEGQILSIAKIEQQIVMAPPSGFGGSGNDNNGNDQTVTIRSDYEDEHEDEQYEDHQDEDEQQEDEHQEDQEDHEDEQEVEHD